MNTLEEFKADQGNSKSDNPLKDKQVYECDTVNGTMEQELDDTDVDIEATKTGLKDTSVLKENILETVPLDKEEQINNTACTIEVDESEKQELDDTDFNIEETKTGLTDSNSVVKKEILENVPLDKEEQLDYTACTIKVEESDNTDFKAIKTNGSCDVCGKKFSNMSRHRKTHTGEKPHACDLCDYRSNFLDHLKTHKLTHTKEKRQCDTCGKLLSLQYYRFHKCHHCSLKSGNANKCECSICAKSFSSPAYLKKHMYLHEGKPYSCDTCDKTFATTYDLKLHTAVHSEIKPFTCSVCDKSFPTAFHLRKHGYIHTNKNDVICDICGKTFRYQSYLTDHLRTHTGSKPHVCTICNKCFPRAYHLKRHMFLHNGQKPYVCDLCGKEFALNDQLLQHKRTHTDDKSHCCDICGKLLRNKKSLDRHKLMHSDQYPHECNICGKRIRLLGNLQKHMRTHNKECKSMVVSTQTLLNKHQWKHGGDLPESDFSYDFGKPDFQNDNDNGIDDTEDIDNENMVKVVKLSGRQDASDINSSHFESSISGIQNREPINYVGNTGYLSVTELVKKNFTSSTHLTSAQPVSDIQDHSCKVQESSQSENYSMQIRSDIFGDKIPIPVDNEQELSRYIASKQLYTETRKSTDLEACRAEPPAIPVSLYPNSFSQQTSDKQSASGKKGMDNQILNSFQCAICAINFSLRDTLERHMLYVHQKELDSE